MKRKKDIMIEDWQTEEINNFKTGSEICLKERKIKKDFFNNI
jgi:hypothetical protein